MDRCLRSRSRPAAVEENAVAVTSNCATQESTLSNEPEQNDTNVETNTQKGVDILNIINVTSGSDESPVSAHQLQNILATFVTALQAENASWPPI
jgi:hypothetical protein